MQDSKDQLVSQSIYLLVNRTGNVLPLCCIMLHSLLQLHSPFPVDKKQTSAFSRCSWWHKHGLQRQGAQLIRQSDCVSDFKRPLLSFVRKLITSALFSSWLKVNTVFISLANLCGEWIVIFQSNLQCHPRMHRDIDVDCNNNLGPDLAPLLQFGLLLDYWLFPVRYLPKCIDTSFLFSLGLRSWYSTFIDL